MSNLVRPKSTEFVEGLVRMIEDRPLTPRANLKSKIEGYVKVIELHKSSQDIECPKVELRKAQSCFRLFLRCQLREICTNWSFCERSVCCTRQTVLNYHNSDANNLIHLVKGRGQTNAQNQLTNASFLLELYNSYGADYLPLVYVCAIDCMKKMGVAAESLRFWEEWDPVSDGYLEISRVGSFKDIMEDAYEVIREARRVVMKKDLQSNLNKLYSGALDNMSLMDLHHHELHQASEEVDRRFVLIKKTPPSERRVLARDDAHKLGSSPLRVKGGSSPKKETPSLGFTGSLEVQVGSLGLQHIEHPPAEIFHKGSPPKEVSHKGSPPKSGTSGSEEMDGVMLADHPVVEFKSFRLLNLNTEGEGSSPGSKCVYLGDVLVPFKCQKIIDDLLLMTDCTEEAAKEIASNIERNVHFPCFRRQIWGEMKKEIYERDIKIKESGQDDLYEELLRYMEDNSLSKIKDVPIDKLTEILFLKKHKSLKRLRRNVRNAAASASVYRDNQHFDMGGMSVNLVLPLAERGQDMNEHSERDKIARESLERLVTDKGETSGVETLV